MVSTAANFRTTPLSRQRGAVLAVTMIMLMTMTIIGIAALSNTRLQENMAGNLQEQVRAMQAADSGVLKAWSETKRAEYNTNVTQFDCPKHNNKRDFTYSQLVDPNGTGPNPDDHQGVTGKAEFRMIGQVADKGWQKKDQGISGGRTPVVFFVWRSQARTHGTKATGSVYMGVSIEGADPGDNLLETGIVESGIVADPC